MDSYNYDEEPHAVSTPWRCSPSLVVFQMRSSPRSFCFMLGLEKLPLSLSASWSENVCFYNAMAVDIVLLGA